jgi:nucleotide-binding universal stress UspA family protein
MNALSGLTELPVPASQRRIVVGYDCSPSANKALDWAIADAQLEPAVIDVVSAWTFPMVTGYSLGHTVLEVEEAARREVDAALARVAEVAPFVAVRGETTDDAPGPALVAASRGADLLVVGSKGIGGLQSVLVGSVSAYCARHAHCTVVIVR